MIRINLLGVARPKARRAFAFDRSQQLAVACALVLVVSAAGIGWWYWSLAQASVQVDAEIAAAQQEAARLRSILAEVQQFEAQRAQLQQRVGLIEQLRRGQSAPVQLIDHISRSVPDMLWLTALEQKGSDVTIEGRSNTLIALSDFVGNLGDRGTLLKKPIEIVNSQVEPAPASATPGVAAPDVIRFTVKAQLADAPGAPATAAAARPGAPR
jgi:type IV pilus assembly protein PilN